MNFYQPLKREADGRYDFVCCTSEGAWAVGYCAPFREWTDEHVARLGIPKDHPQVVRSASFAGKHHSDGHATPEEAAECYRQYRLDHELVLNVENPNQMLRCETCGTWTTLAAMCATYFYPLCINHNNRQEVEKYMPATQKIMSS